MTLPAGLPGPMGAGPITIQVSPSAYKLLLKLIEYCVEYAPSPNDDTIQIIGGAAGPVQAALTTLYNVITPNLAAANELGALQNASLVETNKINQAAGYELVLTC